MEQFELEVTELYKRFEKDYESILAKEYFRLTELGLSEEEAGVVIEEKSNKINKKIRG